jgi:hypothetical protein
MAGELTAAAVNAGSEIVKATEVGHTLADAWAVILGDRIASWRLRNAASLQAKLVDELRDKGVVLNVSRLPNRYAFSWFDEATKHDEDDVQRIFARLLAAAVAGSVEALDCRLIELVSKFTSNEAQVIEYIFSSEGFNKNDGAIEYRKLMVVRKSYNGGIIELRKGVEHLIAIGVLKVETLISVDALNKSMNQFNAAFQKFQETPSDEFRSPLRSSAAQVTKAARNKQKVKLTELGKALNVALTKGS